MIDRSCDTLADRIIEALETGHEGAVRETVTRHAPECSRCRERVGELHALAEGLDPRPAVIRPGFVGRVMDEIRGEARAHSGAYDRLPPMWQLLGAGALLVALAAVVLATGGQGDAWHSRALTGFLNQALVFLGSLSQGITGLWDAVAPGKGLPILIGCAVLATVLNVALVVSCLRRRKETVR